MVCVCHVVCFVCVCLCARVSRLSTLYSLRCTVVMTGTFAGVVHAVLCARSHSPFHENLLILFAARLCACSSPTSCQRVSSLIVRRFVIICGSPSTWTWVSSHLARLTRIPLLYTLPTTHTHTHTHTHICIHTLSLRVATDLCSCATRPQ
jgi:uncharacterized membrane protein YeiH